MNQPVDQWHQFSCEEVAARMETSIVGGLTSEESLKRLSHYGPNELAAADTASPWSILLSQFKNILILILFAAIGLSIILGHNVEAVAIGVIVVFAVLLGFLQEYRAEKAMAALKKMAAPTATVFRDGEEKEARAGDLVPGDLIRIRSGDKIPADARLVEAVNLRTEEAALTGESMPVEKHTSSLTNDQLSVGDRKNMVFAGTIAAYGRGKAIVVSTGMQTEFGRIAGLLAAVESGPTPLQENLKKIGRVLAFAALAVVVLIVGLGLVRGQPVLEMLIFGIALAVAVVPEALPAVVTVSLAIGVQRIVRRNALVRRLSAVETLGCTSYICSDKTGTLTRDEMTVRQIFVNSMLVDVSGSGYDPVGSFSHAGLVIEPSRSLLELLKAGVLASDTQLVQSDGRWHIKGDPTEGAIIVAAAKAGLLKSELDLHSPRIHEIPFTSESKRMTTLHRSTSGVMAYAKGAPEIILASCSQFLSDTGNGRLSESDRDLILSNARDMAGRALRVLAVACKPSADRLTAESDLTFLGLVGMIDPPRQEVKAAIRSCEEAGIRPVMITGDHPLTAEAIARELGILKGGRVVTGAELDPMTDRELEDAVANIQVYARVSPAHKLRVVTALQSRGEVVAMTGDGVNDAPALKKADIGVAMGITGTDVTKEAAVMTLTDDNFASIVAAVEEGRGIFSNIKKYLMYLLSSNIGEIVLMAGAAMIGYPMPLTAVQILYVNLATDGLPALALAMDPPEPDLMRRSPRNPRAGIFTRPVVSLMVVGGLWSAFINLGVFSWALKSGLSMAESVTMTFVSLVLIQFFKAYSFRSDRLSVLIRPFANKWLNLAILWEAVLLLLIVYLPIFQDPVGTFALPLRDWVVVLCAALSIIPVLELAKWMERRGWFGKLA